MARRTITLRLQAKDADKVLNALRQTGAEGRRMADTLERSGRRGSRGLRAIDRAAGGLRAQFNSFASRIPIVGNAMMALGPAGVAGAAGIAALTLGLSQGLRVAREAVRAFDDIAKRADTFNILTDTLQGLRLAAIEEDVGVETMERGLNRLAVGASQAAIGTGTLVTALERSHPELVEAIGNAETMEERLRLVTDALQGARSETEFNNIAYAAFGRAGLDMARMLARAEGGIDGLTQRAREMGVVVDEHVLRNAEEMENRLGVAAQVIDLNLKQAFVDLAPVLVGAAEFIGDVATAISDIVDATRDFEDRTNRGLENQLARKREELAALEEIINDEQALAARAREIYLGRGPTAQLILDNAGGPRQYLRDQYRELQEDIETIDAILAGRADRRPGGGSGGSGDDDGEGATDRATAEREALARVRQAADVRRSLGDITGVLAQREAELADLVANGNLTRAEANRALREYRDELVASTDEGRAAAAVISATATPLEQYNERLFELDRLLASGAISAEVHMRAVIAATEAYEEADPVLSRAAEIREALATTEELVAREQAAVNEMVAAGALTFEEGASWIEQYRESLEQTADAVKELRFEEELLDRVLKGQIETWDDLGRVALQVLADIIRQQIAATDTAQGFGSFLTQIIGSTIGSFTGGSSSGSVGFNAGVTSASVSASAASAVSLGGSGGVKIVAPVVSNESAMRVVINNHADANVQASERRSPTGERELEIHIERIVEGGIATGRFDGAMRGRYRLPSAPSGRG